MLCLRDAWPSFFLSTKSRSSGAQFKKRASVCPHLTRARRMYGSASSFRALHRTFCTTRAASR
ncbi:hypothetical protein DIPPA_01618 [Diplonema papillatum]|nr:hypothetical protein DIPPA_01618 [Diplonema papillatum]